MTISLRSLAWVVVLGLEGCPSFTTMGPARTQAAGVSSIWFSGGAIQTTLVTRDPPDYVERERVALPSFEVGYRLGLGEVADLSLRLGTSGGSIGPRFQLRRSSGDLGGIDVMLETNIGMTGAFAPHEGSFQTGVWLGAALPIGVNLSRGHQVVLAPRACRMEDTASGSATLLGGSLALALRVGGAAEEVLQGTAVGWYLVPECAVMATTAVEGSFEGPIVQCVLGLSGPGGLSDVLGALFLRNDPGD